MNIEEIIKQAINEKRILKFEYKGKDRIVEPHLYGKSKKNIQKDLLHAFQTDGESNRGELGWKNFFTDEVKAIKLIKETFEVEKDFRPNSSKIPIKEVIARVPDPETTKH